MPAPDLLESHNPDPKPYQDPKPKSLNSQATPKNIATQKPKSQKALTIPKPESLMQSRLAVRKKRVPLGCLGFLSNLGLRDV